MKKTSKNYLKFSRPVPGHGFVAPHFSSGAFRFVRMAGKLYLRFVEGVSSIALKNEDFLIDAFHEFYSGEKRLILAFRHSSKMDASVLLYTLTKLLGKSARRRKSPFPSIPHVIFLYGKDVLNWAGKAAVWFFPRLGNIPVVNGESNRDGLTLLRTEMREGRFPIALAPEGQVSYHMHHCFPISSGTASLAKWGLESGKDVTIFPIVIGYRYADDYEQFVRKVMDRWENETGITLEPEVSSPDASNIDGMPPALRPQIHIHNLLIEATHRTLLLLEEFYHLPENLDPQQKEQKNLGQRFALVCEAALAAAESLIGIKPQGNWLDRVFHIRYKGMSNLYPESFNPQDLAPAPRSITDFRSMEARIYIHHSQIVDVLEYFYPGYIQPPCEPERYCEYALNLLDVINRLKGGDINSRYNPGKIKAYVYAGEPVSAGKFFTDDGNSGNGTQKKAQSALLEEIHTALEHMSRDLIVP